MKADPAVESYLREAMTWDADRVAMRERSAQMAWRIAAVAIALLVLVVIALILLMPLKRVEPFVIRVDNTTGLVDVVPAFVGQAEMPEAVTRYFLDHYITVCERFNHATAESDYEECGAFHGAARNQAWFAQWDRTNPDSPLNLHKDGTTIRAQVRSVSFFSRSSGLEDLAQIRYAKSRRTGGTGQAQLTYWIATLQYAYGTPPKDNRLRRWNPLGFRVVDFRAEPEVVASEPPGATSTGRTP